MKNQLTKIIYSCSSVCLLLLLLSCGGGRSSEEGVLTTSIEPLRYFVEQVVGDRYEVRSLMSAGNSPENYQLSARNMVELEESSLLFTVGTLGFERELLSKIAERTEALPYVPLVDDVELLHHEGCEVHGGEGDPHIWMSTENAREIVRRICQEMCAFDTAGIATYEANTAAALARIDELDGRIRSSLEGLTHRTFLIYHPALGYYAHDYGLQQLSIEKDGKRPSVQGLLLLEDECRAAEVRVVLVEKEYAGTTAKRVAEEIGAGYGVIDPLAYDWAEEMWNIAKLLKR